SRRGSALTIRAATKAGMASAANDRLNRRRKLENPPIRSTRPGKHQANRRLALAMTGQRDRASIEDVNQGAIAQRKHVGFRVGRIIGEISYPRRRDGNGRRQQSVVWRKAALEASDDRAANGEQINIIRRADAFAT